MAAIFPPLIVTLTRIVPPNPVPLPSYVPSLYPSAGTLATGVCVVPCPAAPALLFADSETVLIPELFFAAVFLHFFSMSFSFLLYCFSQLWQLCCQKQYFLFHTRDIFPALKQTLRSSLLARLLLSLHQSPSPLCLKTQAPQSQQLQEPAWSRVSSEYFFPPAFLSFRSFSMLPYSLLFSCGLCQTLLFRNQQTSAADIALCLRQRLLDICDHIRFNSEII